MHISWPAATVLLLMASGPVDMSLKILPGAKVMTTPPADRQASACMVKSADFLPALIVERPLRPVMMFDTVLSQGGSASGLKPTLITSEKRSVIFLFGFLHVLQQDVQFLRNSLLGVDNGGM